eukprot:Seg4402.3 transcript_id=Seg4402.3/GoldUCD/mRNA.D3Y31 product="GPI mannosyltransferase 1" protein_id=Seg4402.3/GoldUCD/D3Y31
MMLGKIFTAAAILRIFLIIYGHWHDIYMEVKYTDIDYIVFSDAANHFVNGSSPYNRATYRYTPLLAILMSPNSFLHPYFGKLFFSICDLVVGGLLIKILEQERQFHSGQLEDVNNLGQSFIKGENLMNIAACFWFFNPLTLTISTRGNAESFQAILVLAMLFFVIKGCNFVGGIFYGLAIHFKIYPLIYGFPVLLYIGKKNHVQFPTQGGLKFMIKFLLDLAKSSLTFAASTGITICSITALFYNWYGMEFIEHTYLYHLTRKDLQHNFSPYFYLLYLTSNSSWCHVIGLLAFLPQAISVIILGVKYHEKLSLACFLQTFAFVTFNKVCTSQYFIWYLSLFPIAMPYINVKLHPDATWMIFLWLSSQGIWLFFAYLLEFRRMKVAILVWFASIWFLVVNIYILFKLVAGVRQTQAEEPKSRTNKRLKVT